MEKQPGMRRAPGPDKDKRHATMRTRASSFQANVRLTPDRIGWVKLFRISEIRLIMGSAPRA